MFSLYVDPRRAEKDDEQRTDFPPQDEPIRWVVHPLEDLIALLDQLNRIWHKNIPAIKGQNWSEYHSIFMKQLSDF